jgi:hypothetical protein
LVFLALPHQGFSSATQFQDFIDPFERFCIQHDWDLSQFPEQSTNERLVSFCNDKAAFYQRMVYGDFLGHFLRDLHALAFSKARSSVLLRGCPERHYGVLEELLLSRRNLDSYVYLSILWKNRLATLSDFTKGTKEGLFFLQLGSLSSSEREKQEELASKLLENIARQIVSLRTIDADISAFFEKFKSSILPRRDQIDQEYIRLRIEPTLHLIKMMKEFAERHSTAWAEILNEREAFFFSLCGVTESAGIPIPKSTYVLQVLEEPIGSFSRVAFKQDIKELEEVYSSYQALVEGKEDSFPSPSLPRHSSTMATSQQLSKRHVANPLKKSKRDRISTLDRESAKKVTEAVMQKKPASLPSIELDLNQLTLQETRKVREPTMYDSVGNLTFSQGKITSNSPGVFRTIQKNQGEDTAEGL